MAPTILLGYVFEPYPSGYSIEKSLFKTPPRSTLQQRDFAHLGDALVTLIDYLKYACREGNVGVHVLLCGPQGTGKTELAH